MRDYATIDQAFEVEWNSFPCDKSDIYVIHRQQREAIQHMKVLFLFTLINYLCFTTLPAYGAEPIDLVRVEPGKHSLDIVFQRYLKPQEESAWSDPENISQNDKLDDFSPSIIRDQNNDLMVVWSQSTGPRSSQIIARKMLSGKWQEPLAIESSMEQNTLPSLALDRLGNVWCFWVGFDGVDDEIVAATYSGGEWTQPQRVDRDDNDVPDYHPSGSLNADGILSVTWKHYDQESFSYVDYRSLLELNDPNDQPQWSKPTLTTLNPLVSLGRLPEGFSVPKETSNPKSVVLYLPDLPNQALQYGRIRAGF